MAKSGAKIQHELPRANRHGLGWVPHTHSRVVTEKCPWWLGRRPTKEWRHEWRCFIGKARPRGNVPRPGGEGKSSASCDWQLPRQTTSRLGQEQQGNWLPTIVYGGRTLRGEDSGQSINQSPLLQLPPANLRRPSAPNVTLSPDAMAVTQGPRKAQKPPRWQRLDGAAETTPTQTISQQLGDAPLDPPRKVRLAQITFQRSTLRSKPLITDLPDWQSSSQPCTRHLRDANFGCCAPSSSRCRCTMGTPERVIVGRTAARGWQMLLWTASPLRLGLLGAWDRCQDSGLSLGGQGFRHFGLGRGSAAGRHSASMWSRWPAARDRESARQPRHRRTCHGTFGSSGHQSPARQAHQTLA